MGPHLETHLGMIIGRAFMEKEASSAPEDGDHAVWPCPPWAKGSWKLACVPGPCWASLDNPIPPVLHMDSAGACGPQKPWAGRRSLGCRAGEMLLISSSERQANGKVTPGARKDLRCVSWNAIATCRVTSSLLCFIHGFF